MSQIQIRVLDNNYRRLRRASYMPAVNSTRKRLQRYSYRK